MSPDRVRVFVLPVLSASIGLIAWSGHVLALPTAALYPLIWSWARTRRQAGVVSAVYFLAASRGLPQGVANYYAFDIWPGLLLWLIASSAFVIVHAASWTDTVGWRKPFRFLVACILMAVPPFGIMGWAHPVTAAGVLFPGGGWWGLLAMGTILALMTTRSWRIIAVITAGFWLWSATHWTGPRLAEGFQGVDLQMGAGLGRDASLEHQRDLIALVRDNVRDDARDHARDPVADMIVVLPETALGFWTPGLVRLWQRELAGSRITVVAGAARITPDGYDNVLALISPKSNDVVYRQRMPVPGSMWQPWKRLFGDGGGARAHVFANPVVRIGDRDVAVLICYEQLIVWPVLQSMLHDIDVVIAVGNGWWTEGTSILDIQRASAEAWARLFDKPLVLSFNR
ncbi:conjugal transfer protein TraB (plasmid) [Rhizobium sp. WL3]|uniref:conjugal transfer protein TraB n=1 Tax=Rhizobium sp. WL3 TaxID=2603277 RepID=UPI0011C1F7C1|nr:conjugal transfer protein TraB [Rhizobium sp. WL3]QEE43340.1 conjugal transfer protein TraB [Rhizobium sp. WL3]